LYFILIEIDYQTLTNSNHLTLFPNAKAERIRPRNLQGLCTQHLRALASGNSGDRVRLGERRDGQDRDEAPRQDEAAAVRGREGLGPHTAGPPQEEHGHLRPLVADPLCKAVSQSAGVVLREQGEGSRGVHDGAHRGHRVEGGEGPEDHFHSLEERQ